MLTILTLATHQRTATFECWRCSYFGRSTVFVSYGWHGAVVKEQLASLLAEPKRVGGDGEDFFWIVRTPHHMRTAGTRGCTHYKSIAAGICTGVSRILRAVCRV